VVGENALSFEGTRWQYVHGVADPSLVSPESYTLDWLLMKRPGNDEIQFDLFLDYQHNLTQYPTFQAFCRETQIPALIIWGQHDPFFIPPGPLGARMRRTPAAPRRTGRRARRARPRSARTRTRSLARDW
jgi:pimeloyl-ACP methyl ester carboxylesterase